MAFHTQGFASSSQHTAHLLSATLHLKVQTHLKMNVSPSYVAPIIPPISHHGWFQILVLAHTHCVVSQYKSSQRHPSKSTKPSQNDCLIILDTPSIPPISLHMSPQILALAHPFSLPFKYKSSQRLSTQNKNPSQNECFIKRHTPSIPPISLHVPWNAPNPLIQSSNPPTSPTSPPFTHFPPNPFYITLR